MVRCRTNPLLNSQPTRIRPIAPTRRSTAGTRERSGCSPYGRATTHLALPRACILSVVYRREIAAANMSIAVSPIRLTMSPSCADLIRTSTGLWRRGKDVDGRVNHGHGESTETCRMSDEMSDHPSCANRAPESPHRPIPSRGGVARWPAALPLALLAAGRGDSEHATTLLVQALSRIGGLKAPELPGSPSTEELADLLLDLLDSYADAFPETTLMVAWAPPAARLARSKSITPAAEVEHCGCLEARLIHPKLCPAAK